MWLSWKLKEENKGSELDSKEPYEFWLTDLDNCCGRSIKAMKTVMQERHTKPWSRWREAHPLVADSGNAGDGGDGGGCSNSGHLLPNCQAGRTRSEELNSIVSATIRWAQVCGLCGGIYSSTQKKKNCLGSHDWPRFLPWNSNNQTAYQCPPRTQNLTALGVPLISR